MDEHRTEDMVSKLNRLTKGVVTYPAVGKPFVIRLAGVTHWRGCVWINQTQTIYTGNYPDPDAANDAARKMLGEL